MAYDFDTIARTYDRLNHVMTWGMDRYWRRRAAKEFPIPNSQFSILDVACGTGDMAASLAERGCAVTGVDISEEMLAIARQKAPTVTYTIGDAERLSFADAIFDAVTCAFGVRNFVHLEQGLTEMLRVLKPGGRMVILELATPDSALLLPFYNLYTRYIIPRLGQHIAGNRDAYTYLPESIRRFPKGKQFTDIIVRLGATASERRLTFGVCRMYVCTKN